MSQHHRLPEVARALRLARPRIAASLPAPCIRCGQYVTPEQQWDVGHLVDIAQQIAQHGQVIDHRVGAEHLKCNRTAGGRQGARKTNRARRRTTPVPAPSPIDLRMPDW